MYQQPSASILLIRLILPANNKYIPIFLKQVGLLISQWSIKKKTKYKIKSRKKGKQLICEHEHNLLKSSFHKLIEKNEEHINNFD